MPSGSRAGAGTVAGVARGRARGAARSASRTAASPNPAHRRGTAHGTGAPRQSQPLRASPSAESSGASVRSRDVPLGTRGDLRGPDRAARPATSSSQRGQSLSLLKREHAARQSPAHRRDPDAPLAAEAESVHRPRHFQNSHTQVYNRLLAESAARRARAPRPRDDEGGADHGADDDDEWRVRFGCAPPVPPARRRRVEQTPPRTRGAPGARGRGRGRRLRRSLPGLLVAAGRGEEVGGGRGRRRAPRSPRRHFSPGGLGSSAEDAMSPGRRTSPPTRSTRPAATPASTRRSGTTSGPCPGPSTCSARFGR